MRKYILTVLLASSVAMPAMAQDWAHHRGRGDQTGSTESADEARPARPQRAARPERVERERPQVADRANWSARGAERQRAVEQQQAHQPAFQQSERQVAQRRSWGERRPDGNNGAFGELQRQRSAAPTAERGRIIEQQRFVRRDGGRREGALAGRLMERSRERQGQVVVQRGGNTLYQQRHGDTNRQWTNHWRNDRNYDWRHYRDRNRSIFRLGNYYDPYGSRYRRFSIGFSLFPSYYQSNFWLDDPWMYRLPPAYGPYRWVRYYDDALLVNIYTGQVVDVVYSFFW